MLLSAPGTSATVLVALAASAGIPAAISDGKVRSVPPPAIALMIPPPNAAAAAMARVPPLRLWCARNICLHSSLDGPPGTFRSRSERNHTLGGRTAHFHGD